MAKSKPSWLPEMISVNPWDHTTYDKLYDVFHEDFINNTVQYRGIPVNYDDFIVDERERTFWHVTTREDKGAGGRLPDPRRCEMLSWLRPIIENSDKKEVLTWEYPDGDGTVKVYVWLKEFDYLAIMKKTKKGGLILLTAHWVQYNNYKEKLLQKYHSSK